MERGYERKSRQSTQVMSMQFGAPHAVEIPFGQLLKWFGTNAVRHFVHAGVDTIPFVFQAAATR
jgi:hypothetical protein